MINYGMYRNYTIIDEQGNPRIVQLAFNPMTLVKYKNFTGHELMADFFAIGTDTGKYRDKLSEKVKQMLDEGKFNWETATESDIEILQKMNSGKNTEFIINLLASLIATAEHMNGKPGVDFADILTNMPFEMIFNKDFLREVMEMIVFGLKKNTGLRAATSLK